MWSLCHLLCSALRLSSLSLRDTLPVPEMHQHQYQSKTQLGYLNHIQLARFRRATAQRINFDKVPRGSQIKGLKSVSGLTVQRQKLGCTREPQNRERISSALNATYLQFQLWFPALIAAKQIISISFLAKIWEMMVQNPVRYAASTAWLHQQRNWNFSSVCTCQRWTHSSVLHKWNADDRSDNARMPYQIKSTCG